MTTKSKVQTSGSDYEFSAVPMDKRKSFFSLTIVWTGFVFVITSMMAGGGLAKGLDFKSILIATLLGNLFLSAIAILVSVIASRTGLTFALITRYSFGNKGTRLASLFVPIVNLGWYTIQSATYGHFIAQIFHFGELGRAISMMASALVMGIFAVIGINAITILGYIAIPAIIFLSLATAVKSVGVAGAFQVITDFVPNGTVGGMAGGITIVIGTWILSTATCIADIMRYAKSTKQAICSALIGLVGGNSLLIICGAISAIAVGDSDLTAVLLTLGLVIPSLILMTTNIFTTNASNIYSTSLNLSIAFRMDRKKMISVILVLSALLTLTKPYEIDSLFSFLNLLGVIVPPLAGIILSDYYIVHKSDYPDLEGATVADWNIMSWLTWAVSLVAVFGLKAAAIGLPALNGIIIAAVVYPLLMKLTGKKIVK